MDTKIIIQETTRADLEQLLALWNDGDVMKFVGFPTGLGETMDGMHRWYQYIKKHRPGLNHYSIYEDSIGYCGESYYEIDVVHNNAAALDIKLFKKARGKGIGTKGLNYAMKEAFKNGASKVWVDPKPANHKAIALYERLGFVQKSMPEYLLEDEGGEEMPVYMELEAESRLLARSEKITALQKE